MIGIYAKIPFHGQLKKADRKVAAELAVCLREAAESFGADTLPTEESFFLYFDDTFLPCRLRAAEASRLLVTRLKALAQSLHGWNLIVDAGFDQADEGLRSAKRLWYGIEGDGLFLSSIAAKQLAAYFNLDTRPMGGCLRVTGAPYAGRVLPAEGSVPGPEDRVVDRLVDEIGDLVVGETRARCISVIGPGSSARNSLEAALSRLYKDEAASFLRIRAQALESAPYGPLAEGLGELAAPNARRPGPAELLSGAERGLLEDLKPMLDFLKGSPYRRGYSSTLDVRLRLRASAAFRLYARERRTRSLPAFVLLEGIERFPPETVAILSDLLLGKLAEEGIVVLTSGTALSAAWPTTAMRRTAVSGPSSATLAKAAREAAECLGDQARASELAMIAAGDPFRLRLAQRLAISGQSLDVDMSTPTLAARALATLPSEYARLFLALLLGEGVLEDKEMDDFLDSIGLVKGLRPLIYSALGELGLIEPVGARPRIASAEAAQAASQSLDDGGAAIIGAFSSRLLELREKRLILPSTALYRKIAEGVAAAKGLGSARTEGAGDGSWGPLGNVKLYLDCVGADAIYGGSRSSEKDDSPLGALGGFLSAYAARERDRALALLADLESSTEAALADTASARVAPADAAVLKGSIALAQAAADYADRRPAVAASKSKAALMELHVQGAHPSEARAHRILGLCALAQEQVQESSDYFANAFELAQSIPDALECILSAQAEATAHFILGDLRRSRQRLGSAAAWAERSFRADWETACAFMEGRIELELGRYEAAETAFGRVRAEARIYTREDSARRAEIWTGRAASWAGEDERAREILSRYEKDAEALWFLAELEAWSKRYAPGTRPCGTSPRGFDSEGLPFGRFLLLGFGLRGDRG